MSDKVAVASPWQIAYRQTFQLARTPQFYWFLSHLASLTCLILHTVAATFRGPHSPAALKYYNYSISSTIVTYLIVVRQTYRARPVSLIFSQPLTLLKDDNVQYLLLALVFRVFSARNGNSSTLYPFAVFAFFHCLSYVNTNVIGFVPVLTKEQKARYKATIGHFLKTYHEQSLLVAAHMEVLLVTAYVLPLVKMVIFLQLLRPAYFVRNLQTMVLLAVVVVFNKLRFDQSKYTRALVTQYDARIVQTLSLPVVPPALRNTVFALRQTLIHYLAKIQLPRK
ncbi:uncharacterized protein OGAPODRAFT_17016 [Ogataea polymorpha]|uniref:uncharacterized protein n=1 Tax=Ogataea polymorpha TaxID=460523 RepID=UPI0007F37AE0|nr:uncharacterized protein OGAPODRAFT_17016 [Ogataea polymorpha]OBA15281.1 hypothetical protein OGAPODRAFT_17016 [Ogataea polymorpha]